ncbi:MAG: response regulator transcription factor [Bdellovibrionales bacterium]
MARILVLEDLEESFTLLKNVIAAEHSLVWVQTMGEAMTVYNNQFDLMLVDIRLEDGDGYQFCDWVRSKQQDYKTPIIFITASSTVESRITGYSVGGDDFISKPYNFVELKARIDAKLRRSASYTTKTLEFCGICIDPRAQQAQLRENMNFQNLDLTPIEFKILNLLLLEPEKVFTRDEILNRVWGADIYVYPRSVDTHVSKLRTKLGHKSMLIKSVHGTGYKLSEQDDIDSRESHKILAV